MALFVKHLYNFIVEQLENVVFTMCFGSEPGVANMMRYGIHNLDCLGFHKVRLLRPGNKGRFGEQGKIKCKPVNQLSVSLPRIC